MATITPTYSRKGPRVAITWSGMATGDTITATEIQETPGLMSVHIGGTFGSATVGLNASGANADYVAAKDLADAAISATSDYNAGVSTPGPWLQPTISGGSGDSVNVTVTYWVR